MEDMENKSIENDSTKDNENLTAEKMPKTPVTLSPTDAAEYRAYKKEKKMLEINEAIARSESVVGAQDDAVRVMERASRIRQAAIRVSPSRFLQVKEYLMRGSVKVDCVIGGDGEMMPKVKAYEAKLARRLGAKELTVAVTPSLLDACRYGEIKKELRRVKRAAKKACVKVGMNGGYSYATVARVARIAAEVGAQYFSIPYFVGCERIRFDLAGGCQLEVTEVETLADFKKMMGAGVGRVVTSHGFEIYSEWIKEAENMKLSEKFFVDLIIRKSLILSCQIRFLCLFHSICTR
jgi:deoxyribose-phosphate aldolase